MIKSQQLAWYPSLKPIPTNRSSILSIIDIGSSKIACAILKLKPLDERGLHPLMTHDVEILGLSVHKSEGVKAGHITNVSAAKYAIQSAIAEAEKQARMNIQKALIVTTAGRIGSETFAASHTLSQFQISADDIDQLVVAGRRFSVEPTRLALHAHTLGYQIDGAISVDDPLGMVGEKLELNMHLATADVVAMRNLIFAAESSHIRVQGLVSAPFASGLATLTAEDHEHGALVVDCGADTTSFAVFKSGRMQYVSSVAVGGRNITRDLSRVFTLDFEDAERLKVIHGSAYFAAHERDELVTCKIENGIENQDTSDKSVYRSELNQVIEARVTEIFELVRKSLNEAGFPKGMPAITILTGGASRLTNIADVVERTLQTTVKSADLINFDKLTAENNGAIFSAIAGASVFAQQAGEDYALDPLPMPEEEIKKASEGYFARVGRWLKESF